MENLLKAINELSVENRKEIFEMLAKEFDAAADDFDGFSF